MDSKHIRNFSIIAHIDHGKSTLADRMLEITGTIEARKMRDQVLDSMELEKERGITIKMTPVRMTYRFEGSEYELNLIDTPGHIDFSYEVSRALKAVEGSLLLVDATQGVQAQTLTTLSMARESGLVIIPVITKVDSPLARRSETTAELCSLLGCDESDIALVSGRTGEGVAALLARIIQSVPPPVRGEHEGLQALVFDFSYSSHKGVIVFVRLFSGSVRRGDKLSFAVSKEVFQVIEVGIFKPEATIVDQISAGEIGYIVTGIKSPGIASVGDTVVSEKNPASGLAGYQQPRPVVWASIYPESQDNFDDLRQALARLRLSDSAFSYEEEVSGALGRGYRCGFLGMLHLEIITERLRREFNLDLVVTLPSITYEVVTRNNKNITVYSPHLFPESGEVLSIREPWVDASIITPISYVGILMPFLYDHEAEVGTVEQFGDDRSRVIFSIPLRELMRGFFDELKSITSGYASIAYDTSTLRDADVVRMDMIVGGEPVIAFTRMVSRRRVEEEAEKFVDLLQKLLPRQQVEMKIQAKALGRIVASRTLKAFRKDVTGYLYGGDITRKMKLLEKQKKGKKKMRQHASVNIPHDVFVKVMRGSSE
ncbi:MAG TPA: translation elongation factor 4 [Candidatus Paceibacterota bacterium]|jgi:GTP-binding protein LepA|nr:translation elongation factor 4 [Candidatus Paceibacterota bacterium]